MRREEASKQAAEKLEHWIQLRLRRTYIETVRQPVPVSSFPGASGRDKQTDLHPRRDTFHDGYNGFA